MKAAVPQIRGEDDLSIKAIHPKEGVEKPGSAHPAVVVRTGDTREVCTQTDYLCVNVAVEMDKL